MLLRLMPRIPSALIPLGLPFLPRRIAATSPRFQAPTSHFHNKIRLKLIFSGNQCKHIPQLAINYHLSFFPSHLYESLICTSAERTLVSLSSLIYYIWWLFNTTPGKKCDSALSIIIPQRLLLHSATLSAAFSRTSYKSLIFLGFSAIFWYVTFHGNGFPR